MDPAIDTVEFDKLDGDACELVEKYQAEAKRIVRQGCYLVADPKSAGGIQKMIEGNCMLSDSSESDGVCLIVYNVNTSGEAITNPSNRIPPLRTHFKTCLQGVLQTRVVKSSVHKKDVLTTTNR